MACSESDSGGCLKEFRISAGGEGFQSHGGEKEFAILVEPSGCGKSTAIQLP